MSDIDTTGAAEAFADFKQAVADEDDYKIAVVAMNDASRYGDTLMRIGREDVEGMTGEFSLDACDAASRLVLHAFWGSKAGDALKMDDLHPNNVFAAAFLYAPFSRVMMEDIDLGEAVEETEAGAPIFALSHKGESMDRHIMAARTEDGWKFDLMPLMAYSSELLEAFVKDRYEGDFDAFAAGFFENEAWGYDKARVLAAEQRVKDAQNG